MDWLEEITIRNADVILANSGFTSRVFKAYFPSIPQEPRVVHPGINLFSYEPTGDSGDPDVAMVSLDRPIILSFNRFEKKKNAALAIYAFALFRQWLAKAETRNSLQNYVLSLVAAMTPGLKKYDDLVALIDRAKARPVLYHGHSPPSKTPIPPFNMTHKNPDVLFLLNFTTAQRAALLSPSTTLALLYTPANEHFGIVPVEAMSSGLPVLACNSGGPTESIVDDPPHLRTGWLRTPEAANWAEALLEIAELSPSERAALAGRARARAREHFGMEAMGREMESALLVAAKMGRVPVPAVLWFGSFIVVALFAYFMAIIYAS
ncbi:hypothetical protein EI94DRAFT_1663811 [Lactarius quietus]|nr:hypothetical protein EI94DRAFT_1663811 [Lactarius quietus]